MLLRVDDRVLAAVKVVPGGGAAAGPGVGGVIAGRTDQALRQLRRGLRPRLQPGEVLPGVR